MTSMPYNKTLLRQLKRSLGLPDEPALSRFLAGERDDAAVQALLTGLPDFLDRVSASYDQYERDLDLRTRSLELSSNELLDANNQLRDELQSRERTVQSLRATLRELQPDTEAGEGEDLEALSQWIARLVEEREHSRLALKNQKFALDQHAIVSITNTQGTILYANDKFCEISGYSHDELIGQNHRIVKSGMHSDEIFRGMWQTISDGGVWHGEICNRRKNGELYWVAATIVPLLDEQGLPDQYIAIRTDITARKEAEAGILRAKEAAEAASHAKSEFLANMSHEIRTPMNGILGMTDLLLDTRLDPEQREYLGIVNNSAESLLTIINDILDFSKIEAGKLHIERIAFDLGRTVTETLRTLSMRAHQKNLELICDIGDAVPRQVDGDPGRLRQILVNLIGNAIKFTEHGEITLRVDIAGSADRIRFAVSDTGIGIPADKQAHIFEAFTQVDGSTTRRYGGTGLGLSITSRLVSLMEGTLQLHSVPGKGSTFSFELPLPPRSSERIVRPAVDDLHDRRVMLVDDHPVNQRVLAHMLEKLGAQVEPHASADSLLKALHHGANPEAILLDAQMPGMDGFQLAATLQAQYGANLAPMVMLSSGAAAGDAQHCRESGIAGYLSKPVSSEELLAMLDRVLHLGDTRSATPGATLITRHSIADEHVSHQILLVEDHVVNQKLAITLLNKWRQTVTVANNGAEALAIFDQRRFDLILMDMQMPIMGGLEATTAIRQREAARGIDRTPVIALTANAMQGDRKMCLEAGMDDYIAKPIRAADLAGVLARFGIIERHVHPVESFDYASALARADRETIDIVRQPFLDTYQRDLELLASALDETDLTTAERLAHTLRGTLATFLARPAADTAHTIELAARSGEGHRARENLPALNREVERLAVTLQEH